MTRQELDVFTTKLREVEAKLSKTRNDLRDIVEEGRSLISDIEEAEDANISFAVESLKDAIEGLDRAADVLSRQV